MNKKHRDALLEKGGTGLKWTKKRFGWGEISIEMNSFTFYNSTILLFDILRIRKFENFTIRHIANSRI